METATTLARSWKLPWLSTRTWRFSYDRSLDRQERIQILLSLTLPRPPWAWPILKTQGNLSWARIWQIKVTFGSFKVVIPNRRCSLYAVCQEFEGNINYKEIIICTPFSGLLSPKKFCTYMIIHKFKDKIETFSTVIKKGPRIKDAYCSSHWVEDFWRNEIYLQPTLSIKSLLE